ncbi:MAG: type I methionyl aminopeptidase, partial [Elusimicrobiota bacterium]
MMFKAASVDIKSPKEIAVIREAGAIVAETLKLLAEAAVPGISTEELDAIAGKNIRKHKAKPAFLGYRGYPTALCASINEEVVHGIPSLQRKLKEGDILGMDLGAIINGFYGDAAMTVAVGKISKEARSLLKVAEDALEKGIAEMRPDNRLGDIGAAIQRVAEDAGYSVVREFVGHGIGRALHEDPAVPNYGNRGTGMRLREGMVLALEPMINEGTHEVRVLEDHWTAVTADGKLSAHFEHTVAITEKGPEILTL